MVLIVAMAAAGALGCSDGDDRSSTASTTAPTTTEATSTSTSTSTTTTAPAEPRGLGSATTSDDEPTPSADTPSDDPTSPNGERELSEIEVGECIDAPGLRDLDVTELTAAIARACDEPHDAEVYARVSLNDDPDAEHPGDEHVVAAADQVCFERFEPYVGRRYVDARLEIVHLRPTVASWQRGDRSVVCMLINASGEPLAGTMAAGSE